MAFTHHGCCGTVLTLSPGLVGLCWPGPGHQGLSDSDNRLGFQNPSGQLDDEAAVMTGDFFSLNCPLINEELWFNSVASQSEMLGLIHGGCWLCHGVCLCVCNPIGAQHRCVQWCRVWSGQACMLRQPMECMCDTPLVCLHQVCLPCGMHIMSTHT